LTKLKRSKEAIEGIKKLLFKNMTNFTCWHVYGLIMRQQKDYDQARRAYLNALKYNPDHEQAMRDLSSLQIFLRDYQGFEESRRQLLIHSPSGVGNWITLATA